MQRTQKNAQLIFTTHETAILNQGIFRRDQIWFCEKDEDQATALYPLTDFSPRKGRENLKLAYLSGRFTLYTFPGRGRVTSARGPSRKRESKRPRDLAHPKARREPYRKVLIVCEGKKTEPQYFRDLKDHYKLNTATIERCAGG